MIDPRLFSPPRFVASIAGALFTGLAVIGLMSYAPTFFRVARLERARQRWRARGVVGHEHAGRVSRPVASRPGRHRGALAAGLCLAAMGEVALAGLDGGTGWPGSSRA